MALLVQPEQLSMLSGHLPCLARIIQQDCLFWKQIAQVHVDEAHFIYTTGVEHYGLPSFHPAWGQLGEFRIVLKGPVFRTACEPETGPNWTEMDRTFSPGPCF